MKKTIVLGIILAMAGPGLAQAGGYTVSQDGNVVIYRGQSPVVDARALRTHQMQQYREAESRRLNARIRAQKRALKAQTAEIERLEHKIEHLQERLENRRPRYGRSYYGNNRFFGVNGFIGNRNYSGGTIYVGRRRGN